MPTVALEGIIDDAETILHLFKVKICKNKTSHDYIIFNGTMDA